VTRAELEPLIATVRSGLAKVKRVVEGISDELIHAANVGAYNTLARAVESWSTTQANEVVAGTRPYERWRKYAAEGDGSLIRQIESFARDSGELAAQFSRAARIVGGAAEATVDALEAKVKPLRQQLDEFTKNEATWKRERAALANVQSRLSPAVRDVYFGSPAEKAQASLKRFRVLVVGLEAGVKALREGKTPPFDELKRQAGLAGGMGVTLVVGAGAALAIIAVAVSLAVSIKAYFKHATEVTRAELDKIELELIREGKGEQVLQFKKLRNEAEQIRGDAEGPSAAEVVGYLVLAGAAVGGAVLLYRWWKSRRLTNPRRKRAKNKGNRSTASRPALEAHAA